MDVVDKSGIGATIIAEPLSPSGGGGSSSLTTEYSESVFAPLTTDEEQFCEVCGKRPAEPHHWIHTRGAGGSDDIWNTLWLCREHHDIAGAVGRDTFYEMFKARLHPLRVQHWLQHRGDLP
jgi:Protein of unknown function (DUF968).